MKISDLPIDKIVIGMKVRSLVDSNKIGEIIKIDDPNEEMYSWILWPGEIEPYSGFWWNHCDCEIS